MRLEGRLTSWFTSTMELSLDGQVLGLVRREWFRDGFQLQLLGRTVRLERPSWLKSHYVLRDDQGVELGSATLVGIFMPHWDMELKSGPGILQRAGWFTNSFVLKQGDNVTAEVGRVKWWSFNWAVVAADTLSPVDVLLVGLMFVTIRARESRRNSG